MADHTPAPAAPRSSRRLGRFLGRDPREAHRAATPLELLYDLTIVIAFAAASSQAAHLLAEGRWLPAIGGFAFIMFGIVWAWINYSWFMSAYDTDDWFVRIATMVQMLGVLVLALGVPDVFRSFDAGDRLDNQVVVLGYVIMRVAMLAMWIRAAVQDRERRPLALAYVATIAIAQIGWVAVALLPLSIPVTAISCALLYALEIGGPLLADRKYGAIPWHPEHIAERYSLLTIIALGEIIVGAAASISSLIDSAGWTPEAVLIGLLGVGMAGGCWWTYFAVPWGEMLGLRPDRAFHFGYVHPVVFAGIVGLGAGLHVAALAMAGEVHIEPWQVLATLAAPLMLFLFGLFGSYAMFIPWMDRLHAVMVAASALIVAAAFAVVLLGGPLWAGLALALLSPWALVVGVELAGRAHIEEGLGWLRDRALSREEAAREAAAPSSPRPAR